MLMKERHSALVEVRALLSEPKEDHEELYNRITQYWPDKSVVINRDLMAGYTIDENTKFELRKSQ